MAHGCASFSYPTSTPSLSSDVLVLGAGLAGLRAALAAAEVPDTTILLAHAGGGGSSFANRNDALGVQAPETDAEREMLAARITERGAPGFVDEALVRLLCAEAHARAEELATYGARYRRDSAGHLLRLGGCFCQDISTARVYDGLARVRQGLLGRARELGVTELAPARAARLLKDAGGRAAGALVWHTRERRWLRLAARAVVLAVGGSAPLFQHDVSGPGNLGYGLGLLDQAGAKLANCGYLQWMWYTREMRFVPLAQLCREGVLVNGEPVPEEPRSLAPSRDSHCPASHALPDAALDRFVAARAEADGWTRINVVPSAATELLPAGEHCIAPMAHAQNGGAVIDAWGETSVPGLFAAGECATGMHGADRLGGAMIAATQVFGHRAGKAAARRAHEDGAGAPVLPEPPPAPPEPPPAWLRGAMQRACPPFAPSATRTARADLQEGLLAERAARETSSAPDLSIASALAVVHGLLTPPRHADDTDPS